MKRSTGPWFLLALVAVLPVWAQSQRVVRQEIAAGTKVVRVKGAPTKPKPSPAATPSAPSAEAPAVGGGGGSGAGNAPEIDFQLVRALPMQGNDLFNQRTPFNTTLADGRRMEFNTFQEMAVAMGGNVNNVNAAVGGGGGGGGAGGGLAACNGAMTNFAASNEPGVPADLRFAGIEINPNTGACRVRSDGSGGLALFFQSPPDGPAPGDQTRYTFSVDNLEMIWTHVDPPPQFGGFQSLFGVVQNVTIRATSGLTVRIQFVVNGTNPNDLVLTVNSITQL